jgi:hypothetical protein
MDNEIDEYNVIRGGILEEKILLYIRDVSTVTYFVI